MKNIKTFFISLLCSNGIKLSINVTKYYRTRLGHREVYRISKSITGGVIY